MLVLAYVDHAERDKFVRNEKLTQTLSNLDVNYTHTNENTCAVYVLLIGRFGRPGGG